MTGRLPAIGSESAGTGRFRRVAAANRRPRRADRPLHIHSQPPVVLQITHPQPDPRCEPMIPRQLPEPQPLHELSRQPRVITHRCLLARGGLRYESPTISTISASCSSRSIAALASKASPNNPYHSSIARLLVMTIDPRSYCRRMTS